MSAPDLTWDEAMKLVAVDRDQLLRRMPDHTKPILSLGGRKVRLGHWVWQISDLRDGSVITSGRAVTERGMVRRRYRAYLKELGK